MSLPLTWVYRQQRTVMKIASKKIRLPFKLFPWQEDIIRGLLDHPHDIHLAKSKRQVGKSVTVEVLLLYFAINKARSCSICISPTLTQSRKIYKEIVKGVQKSPVYEGSNSTTLEINFTNGSCIKFRSGEQREALRGETVTGLLALDEAVFLQDEVIFNTFPFVDANRAPILMTSTPKFKTGVFYDFFTKGEAGEKGFHSYDVCNYDTSVLLPLERLEMYRKSVAPQIFKSEYLGQFIEAVSTVFGDVEKLCGTILHKAGQRVMGVDWSNGAMDKSGNPDETAIAVMNEHHELEFIEGFSDKEVNETIDYIVKKIKEYDIKKVVVEMNSMGATYVNLLKRKISALGIRCQVIEFFTTNDTKRDIIENLQVQCLNGTIQLIKDNKLLLEMVSYMSEKTPTGKITYNGSPGVHDDLVIALALALHALKSGTYNIR